MRVSTLARVRWRILEWLLPFLFLALLVNNIQPIRGAPQTHSRFSNPQRQQNPSFNQAGPFRIIPDEDDFEDVIFSTGRQRNFGSGASSSFGVPLSATRTGARQETLSGARSHFGAPHSSFTSGTRSNNQQRQSASFGVPLSDAQPGPTQTISTAARSHFGVPLSATRPGARQEARKESRPSLSGVSQKTSQAARAHFGVPLSSTRFGSIQQTPHVEKHHFGISRAQPGQAFSIRRDSVEDLIDDVSVERKSHFSLPTHRNVNKQRFFFDTDDRDDNISIERFDKSSEIISLGRRFHPEGIPRLSEATLTNVPISARDPVISHPYIFTPGAASIDRDSIEDDDDIDDDTFIVLSPMVKAYNPSGHNERLSLSNDFLNQYNFVDVQGSTHWGYKTDNQYQDHKIHDSGAMEGKFGWTSPEGSEVNIKYIADERGYRVLSSSGIYTKEDDAVLRLKELHLAEHEKAKIYHQNIKAERNEGKTGVPLPGFKGAQGSSISGSGGFVVVPDEDDFPLVPSRPQTGVPLPTLTNTNIRSEPEVGVFIDSSVVGVPLPTPSQDRGTGFGIPLPDHVVTKDHSSSVPHSFGVPLPDPSLTGAQDTGAFLPDPTFSGSSGHQAGGVPLPGVGISTQDSTFTANENVGVPLPDSTFTRGENLGQSFSGSTFSEGAQGVGVPLPDPTLLGNFQPQTPETTFFGSHGVGVPFPDPSLSGTFGTGAPLPDPTFSGASGSNFGVDSTFTGNSHSGVPLPDPTFSGASKDQTVGVPLPAPTLFETSRHQGVGVPLSGQTLSGADRAGVPLAGSTFSDNQNVGPFSDPALSGFQGVGVPLPDPSLSGSHGVGVPLAETTFHRAPAGESVGVSLSDSAQRSPHGGSTAGVALPDHFLSGNQNFGAPLFDPVLTSQHGTIPQSDPTFTGNEAFGVPLAATFGHQATGVFIPDRASVGGPGKTSILSSDKNFGVPLSGGIDMKKEPKKSSVVSEKVGEASTFDSDLLKNGEDAKSSTSFDSAVSLGDMKSTPAGQELKVTFIDTKSSLDSTHLPGQKFGVPLSVTITKDSVDAFQTSDHKDHTNLKNEKPKTPIMDPIEIFGLATHSSDSSFTSGIATDPFPTEETHKPFGIPLSTQKEILPGKTSVSIDDSSIHTSVGSDIRNFDEKHQSFGVPLFTQDEFLSGTRASAADSSTPFKMAIDSKPAEETQEAFGVSLSIIPESSPKASDSSKPAVDFSVSSVATPDSLPVEKTQGTFGVSLSNQNELISSLSKPTVVHSASSDIDPNNILSEDTQAAFGVSLFTKKELSPSTGEPVVDSTIPFKIVPDSMPTKKIQETFGVPLSIQTSLPSLVDFSIPSDTTSDIAPIEKKQENFGAPLSITPELSSKATDPLKTTVDFSISSAMAPDALPTEDTRGTFGVSLFNQNELTSSIIEPTVGHSAFSDAASNTILKENAQGASGISLFTQNELLRGTNEPAGAVDSSIPSKSVPETFPTEKRQEAFGVPLSIHTILSSSKANELTEPIFDSPILSNVAPSHVPIEETQGAFGVSLITDSEISSVKTSEPTVGSVDFLIPSKSVPEAVTNEKKQEAFGVPLSIHTILPSSKTNELVEPTVDSPILSDVLPSHVPIEETQGAFGVSLIIDPEISSVKTSDSAAGSVDSLFPSKIVPETVPTEKKQEAFGAPLFIHTILPSSKTNELIEPTVDSPILSDVLPSHVPIEETQGTFGVSLITDFEISSAKTSEPAGVVDSSIPSKSVPEIVHTEKRQETFGVPFSIHTILPSSKTHELIVPVVDSPIPSNVVSSDGSTKETQGAFGVSLFTDSEISSVKTNDPKVQAVDSSVPSDVIFASIPRQRVFDVSQAPLDEQHSIKTTHSAADSSAPSSLVPETFPTKETPSFGVPLSTIIADLSSAKTSEQPFDALFPNEHNTEINSFGASLLPVAPSLSDFSSVAKFSAADHSVPALDVSSQTSFHSGAHEQTIVPLESVPLIPSTGGSVSQTGKKFFLVTDSVISGVPQDFGVGLEEGTFNALPPLNKQPSPTGGSHFGSLPNVGVPLFPVTFSDVDLLQGPPVEQLDPSIIADRSPMGLDPCLNSKLHPTLLPPHCANANVEPDQRLGKSLIPSRSKKEQDSFIVVVNSDIFQ